MTDNERHFHLQCRRPKSRRHWKKASSFRSSRFPRRAGSERDRQRPATRRRLECTYKLSCTPGGIGNRPRGLCSYFAPNKCRRIRACNATLYTPGDPREKIQRNLRPILKHLLVHPQRANFRDSFAHSIGKSRNLAHCKISNIQSYHKNSNFQQKIKMRSMK